MNRLLLLTLGWLTSVICASQLPAQTDPMHQLNGHLASLQAQINDLRYRLDSPGYSELAEPGCGYQAGSGSCGQGCGCCCRCQSGFTAGYDYVYIRPRFLEAYDIQVTNPFSRTSNLLPLDFGYSHSPRVFLAWKSGRGPGIRAQYWQYEDSTARSFVSGPETFATTQVAAVFPATVAAIGGDRLSVENELRTQTMDLEGTWDLSVSNMEVSGHLGVRYAEINQQRLATVVGTFPQQLDFTRNFNGLGFVGGAETRRSIGRSGLALLIKGGGSVVHGDKTVNRTLTGIYPPALPDPLPAPPVVRLEDAKETTLIGEIAIGIELRKRLGHCNWSGRVMYENRVWTGPSTPVLGIIGFEGWSVGLGTTF